MLMLIESSMRKLRAAREIYMRTARMLAPTDGRVHFGRETSIKLGLEPNNFLAPALRCSFELLSANLHTHQRRRHAALCNEKASGACSPVL
jgi:hypothetical protein